MNILSGLLGILVILDLVWLLSSDKKHFPVRIVVIGLSMQLLLGFK